MPELYPWKEEYSVGISTIDVQHKKWISMVNSLHSAMQKGKGKDTLVSTINDIVKYTATHFTYEEEEMRAYHYPALERHKRIHDKFKSEMANLHKKAKNGEISVTVEVMDKMVNWLVNHIMVEDKQYSPCMSKEAEKKAA